MNIIKKIVKKILFSLGFKNQKNIYIKDLLNKRAIIAEATSNENLIMESDEDGVENDSGEFKSKLLTFRTGRQIRVFYPKDD